MHCFSKPRLFSTQQRLEPDVPCDVFKTLQEKKIRGVSVHKDSACFSRDSESGSILFFLVHKTLMIYSNSICNIKSDTPAHQCVTTRLQQLK